VFNRPQKRQLNNRGQKRLPTMLRVEYSSGADIYTTYSTNISFGGLYLQGSDQLRPGTRLHMRINTPEGFVRVVGRVAWMKQGNGAAIIPGAGIEFQQMSPESREILDRFLVEYYA